MGGALRTWLGRADGCAFDWGVLGCGRDEQELGEAPGDGRGAGGGDLGGGC